MTIDPTRSGDPRAGRRAAYAEDLAREGNTQAAVDLMREAVELDPHWTLARVRLADLQAENGHRKDAIEVLEEAAGRDPDGRLGIGLKLAALGAAAVPEAAPPAYVEALFDQYAERFEHSLVNRLGYRMPDILFDDLKSLAGLPVFPAALDLGCGTGLMGERLRPVAERLDGVDLSAAMLRKARAKGIYDSLTRGDILDARLEWTGAYDLVTAADVLIYIGELAPVMASIARRLKPGGLVAFSVERGEDDVAFAVQPSLRFAHGSDALRKTLEHAGFRIESWRACTARTDRGAGVPGLAVIAALQPAQR